MKKPSSIILIVGVLAVLALMNLNGSDYVVEEMPRDNRSDNVVQEVPRAEAPPAKTRSRGTTTAVRKLPSRLSKNSVVRRSDSRPSESKWSATKPRVNLPHIFEGEINRSGKPVGFHSRPGGNDPAQARLIRQESRPNRAGVYTATVEIRDGNQWKLKFSSFFPDNMNRAEVIGVIVRAHRDSPEPSRQPWVGESGEGFDIQGYTLSNGDINTAFPVYRRD
jgi:hypothetical protein